MNILPFEQLRYRTKLSKEEILARLTQNVKEEKLSLFFRPRSERPYAGEITDNQFKLKRVISYKNSYQPIVNGEITEDQYGTKVDVKMNMHKFILAFALFGALMIPAIFYFNPMFQEKIWVVGLLALLQPVMIVGFFKYESTKSKKYFKELFEADLEEL